MISVAQFRAGGFMNTPNHATDAQINELWRLLQLETARNFEQAYRAQAILTDERERYAGNDPRNHTGEKINVR